MFSSSVIDLVILLSFTYFIGSLILSAINEAIAGTFRLRQRDLRKALFNFFFDPGWKAFVRGTFLKSPHIQSLMKKPNKLPVYIPARSFVLALIENLDTENYRKGELKEKDNKDVLPKNVLQVMQDLMNQVKDLEPSERNKEFEAKLEEFYNSTMDRVTGWYKRRIRRILIIIGLILSIVLNIDTIRIMNVAMSNPGKLSKTVDNIAANLSKLDSLQGDILVEDDTLRTTLQTSKSNVNRLRIIYNQTSEYQLGYASPEDFKAQWEKDFWKKLFGVLLTAFALQLGSTYWFDLMNKAVNIRAAGKRPDDKQTDKNKQS